MYKKRGNEYGAEFERGGVWVRVAYEYVGGLWGYVVEVRKERGGPPVQVVQAPRVGSLFQRVERRAARDIARVVDQWGTSSPPAQQMELL